MTRPAALGIAAVLLGLTGCRHNCCGTTGLGLFNRTPTCSPTNATPVSYGNPMYGGGGSMMMPSGYGTLTSRPVISGVPTVPFTPGPVTTMPDAVTELPYPAPAIPPTVNPTRAVGLPK
jgi:hypothetical protein